MQYEVDWTKPCVCVHMRAFIYLVILHYDSQGGFTEWIT